jgi:hypothetical protein
MTIKTPYKCDFEGIMEYNSQINRLVGIATIKYTNGNIYEGETQENSESGWGIFKRHDNYIFKGEKKDNKFNGYCEIYYPDNSKYFGWFVNNKREGLGISITNDSVYCMGRYTDDVKNGGCILCTKTCLKFELWLYGFMVKSIEKKEGIISYISKVYPEYQYLYKTDNKYLAQLLWNIQD